MRLVTIAADHAFGVHQALLEGVVVEDLVLHLAIILEQAGRQRHRAMGVGDRAAGAPVRADLAAPRMAARAGLYLVAGGAGDARGRTARARIRRPIGSGAGGRDRGEALQGRGAIGPRLRPGEMAAGGAVARLASDAELRPACAEAVGGGLIALAQIRGVTLGAHMVPVLLEPRPVPAVRWRDRLLAIDQEPALPALGSGPRIPGEGQGLDAPVREGHEILLQRLPAEAVVDREGGEPAVGAGQLDPVSLALPEEPHRHAGLLDRSAGEIATHGRGPGMVHGMGVMRAGPVDRLSGMATGAGRRADKGRGLRAMSRNGTGAARFQPGGRDEDAGDESDPAGPESPFPP